MAAMTAKLRTLLDQDNMLTLPGCYDCITARAIQRSGSEAAYMSGAATSFALGYPDYGLITMSEMIDNAARIANAVNIPVISDADTGYGNVLNVTRTVREFEARGIAGIHIEDQEFPKRCGHLEDKRIIPLVEYLQKIKAALEARRDPDFLIIARTDARASNGLQDAIDRGNAALDAGADMVFIEALQTLEELAAVPRRIHGPVMLNIVWNGKTPNISTVEAGKLGYKAAIAPVLLLRAVLMACEESLEEFNQTGVHPVLKKNWNVADYFAFNGAKEWDEIRSRYE
jgi:2-methylisocitrate lyase-like PEP mutase family enzyme